MTHHGWYVLTVFRHAEIALKCEMVHGQKIYQTYTSFAIYHQNINGFQ